jgi:predicted flap endonuclease-1-like 5' DNA nuclease
MANKFYFLRFVVVLLKILAILILLGGLAGAILGFSGVLSSGGQWQSALRLVAQIGGIIVLLAALYYGVIFWGLSDLIRVQLSIEENTRQTHVEVARLEQVFSAERIGRAVSDAMATRVVSERPWPPPPLAGTFRETTIGAAAPAAAPTAAAVQAVQAPPREAQPTVTAVAVEPGVQEVTVVAAAAREAPAKTIEAVVQAIEAEPLAEKVTVAAPVAPEFEPRRTETLIEEAVSEAESVLPEVAEAAIPESAAMRDETSLVTPVPAEPVLEPARAAAEKLQESTPQDLRPQPDDARVMTWTGDEGVGMEAKPEEPAVAGAPEGGPQQPPELAGSVMTWAGDRPAQQEMPEAVSTAEAEAGQQELQPAEAALDMEEVRARAKEALDRSLGEAARQMAELEGPAVPVASTEAAEDNLGEIAGIGPVFRVRLRQAGITTYAALAAMTPTQLAAVTEQTVERITRDDWIGQAQRRLAVG